MNIVLSIFIALLLLGCGGGDTDTVSRSKSQTVAASKDTTTPAEQGGYGFEKLAKSLEYESYIWSEEIDGTYFGDPKAKKGGTLNYIHSIFPLSLIHI